MRGHYLIQRLTLVICVMPVNGNSFLSAARKAVTDRTNGAHDTLSNVNIPRLVSVASDKSRQLVDKISNADLPGLVREKSHELADSVSQVDMSGLYISGGDKSEQFAVAISNVDLKELLATADEKSKDFADSLTKENMIDFANRVQEDAEKGIKWVNVTCSDPHYAPICAALAPGLVAVTLVVAPGMVVSPVLGVFGFGSGGVLAGSWAAFYQSFVGNIVARSLFAHLQSAAMGGYGVGAIYPIVQAAGGYTGYYTLRDLMRSYSMEDAEKESESQWQHEEEQAQTGSLL